MAQFQRIEILMSDAASNRSDFYVYVLFHHETGQPFYIGKGCGRRIDQHLKDCGGDSRRAQIVRSARDAGVDLPRVRIRENLTEDVALEIEETLIAALGREPSGPLVNVALGGQRNAGWKQPEHVVAGMVARHTGQKRSKEWRDAISKALRGKKKSPQAIMNHAASLRGRNMPQDQRDKIRAAHLGLPCAAGTREALIESNIRRGDAAKYRKMQRAQTENLVAMMGFGA